MRRYKRLQRNAYNQSLLIIMIIFISDVFSFFVVKGILSNINDGYHLSVGSIPVASNKFLRATGQWEIKDFTFSGNNLDNDENSLNAPVSVSWVSDVSDLKSQMIFRFTEPDLTELSDDDRSLAIGYLKSLIGTTLTLKSIKEDKSDNQIFVSNTISEVDDDGKVTLKGSCTPINLISMSKDDLGNTINYTKNLVLSISVSDNSKNSLSDVISNLFKLEEMGLRFKLEGTVYNSIPSKDSESSDNSSQKNGGDQEVINNDKNDEVQERSKKKWIWERESLFRNLNREDSKEEKNSESFVKCLKRKHEDKRTNSITNKSNLKETSENLIIDIVPLLLIGCVVFFKRKELFELKCNH